MKTDFLFRKQRTVYGKVHCISVSRIYPNRSQPRRHFDDEKILTLSESIVKYGILQPLIVRFAGDGSKKCTDPDTACFELISGERRLRAAKLAGYSEVPCMILDADDRRSAELAVIENVQRQDLDFFEQAGAIASLIDTYGISQEDAAHIIGSSRSAVSNKLRLLKLTPPERKLILENSLSERHARALLRLADPNDRIPVLREIIRSNMNVSQTDEYVDKITCSCGIMPSLSEKRRRKPAVKDIRLFYNTINRAISTMERAGISIAKEKHESDSEVEFVIKIIKRPA